MGLLVIISGQPGSGKTTLGRRLATDLQLPFVNKDGIKERLYDTLGTGDGEWSKKLGLATYEILYHVVELVLTAGGSVMAESNFDPEVAAPRFGDLQERYGPRIVEVHCVADGEVLWRRYKDRDERRERHPGHIDEGRKKELEARLRFGAQEPVGLGTVIELDTTDFERVEYDAVKGALERFL